MPQISRKVINTPHAKLEPISISGKDGTRTHAWEEHVPFMVEDVITHNKGSLSSGIVTQHISRFFSQYSFLLYFIQILFDF